MNYPSNKGPNIPEETMKAMAQFFMKTSIPRILEEKKRKESVLNGGENIEPTIKGDDEKITSTYEKNITSRDFGKGKTKETKSTRRKFEH